MTTPVYIPSLVDLPTEVLSIVVGWLGRPRDLASLDVTCSCMHAVCSDASRRRLRANRLAACTFMDAFVDEWQRITADCDDDEIKCRLVDAKRECVTKPYDAADDDDHDDDGDRNAKRDARRDDNDENAGGVQDNDMGDDGITNVNDNDGGNDGGTDNDDGDDARHGHDTGDNDTIQTSVKAVDEEDDGGTRDDDDGDNGVPTAQISGFRIYRCVRSHVFDLGSPALDPCTHTPDWSLHSRLPGSTSGVVCDACAHGVSILLDDPDHTRWPMTRIHLDRPHVWANCRGGVPTSYASTPPVGALRVPESMDMWVNAHAAACLAQDIRRARHLLDAEYSLSGQVDYYDHETYNDNDLYDTEAVAKLGIVPRTVVQSDLGHDDSDDGESDDDNSTPLGRAKRRFAAYVMSHHAAGNADDGNGDVIANNTNGDDNNNGNDSDSDVDEHDEYDDQDSDDESDLSEVVLDVSGKAAPCHDPFRRLTHSGRYAWWGSAAPAALVRIYHVPVSIMGNLRAWLPIGMTKGRYRQPHRGDITRYVLVCCDPTSPLWGAAVAVRSVTDRWPCISWLPAADNVVAALAVYRTSIHKPTAATGLREGFVDWLCTARRTPTPLTWEARRDAAIARGQPVLPHWTGFPHFS
ncbi:hypothetical protein pclt_cds_123 [Pandoravirus celtis]|uniref:F-box domain containing protein n=1 Tax=Pandoravirus celtis TaxID=2568002 RepID=A0A4D6EFR4_9VIRU|nr:hypothetical protein pclt_cds_123 [Pandoravirus celtis]